MVHTAMDVSQTNDIIVARTEIFKAYFEWENYSRLDASVCTYYNHILLVLESIAAIRQTKGANKYKRMSNLCPVWHHTSEFLPEHPAISVCNDPSSGTDPSLPVQTPGDLTDSQYERPCIVSRNNLLLKSKRLEDVTLLTVMFFYCVLCLH